MEFNQIEKRECIVMFNTMKILHTGARDAQERQAALLRSFVSRHVDTHTHIKKKEKKKAISFSLFFVFFFFWLACFEKRKKKLQRPVRLHSRKFLGQQPLQPDMSTNAPSSSISYTSGISIFFFFFFSFSFLLNVVQKEDFHLLKRDFSFLLLLFRMLLLLL